MTDMREQAERNDKGRLVWEQTVAAAAGGHVTTEIDVTALLRPGERKTGNIEHLIIEAELHAEEEGGGNPAKPVDAETAKRAIEELEQRGLEPAWRQVETRGEFP